MIGCLLNVGTKWMNMLFHAYNVIAYNMCRFSGVVQNLVVEREHLVSHVERRVETSSSRSRREKITSEPASNQPQFWRNNI